MSSVSRFYQFREEMLEGQYSTVMANLSNFALPQLSELDSLIQDLVMLRNYVVLNYMAVVKIVKKWNKNVVSLEESKMIDAANLLLTQVFYTSKTVADLLNNSEAMKARLVGMQPSGGAAGPAMNVPTGEAGLTTVSVGRLLTPLNDAEAALSPSAILHRGPLSEVLGGQPTEQQGASAGTETSKAPKLADGRKGEGHDPKADQDPKTGSTNNFTNVPREGSNLGGYEPELDFLGDREDTTGLLSMDISPGLSTALLTPACLMSQSGLTPVMSQPPNSNPIQSHSQFQAWQTNFLLQQALGLGRTPPASFNEPAAMMPTGSTSDKNKSGALHGEPESQPVPQSQPGAKLVPSRAQINGLAVETSQGQAPMNAGNTGASQGQGQAQAQAQGQAQVPAQAQAQAQMLAQRQQQQSLDATATRVFEQSTRFPTVPPPNEAPPVDKTSSATAMAALPAVVPPSMSGMKEGAGLQSNSLNPATDAMSVFEGDLMCGSGQRLPRCLLHPSQHDKFEFQPKRKRGRPRKSSGDPEPEIPPLKELKFQTGPNGEPLSEREKNRLAARLFRKRQEDYISRLEAKAAELENENNELERVSASLTAANLQLKKIVDAGGEEASAAVAAPTN